MDRVIDERAYYEATQEWEFSDTDMVRAGSEAWLRGFLARYEAALTPTTLEQNGYTSAERGHETADSGTRQPDDYRATFEIWARHHARDVRRSKYAVDLYSDTNVHRMWEAWQAALATQASGPGQKLLIADKGENVWRDSNGDIWEPIRARVLERESVDFGALAMHVASALGAMQGYGFQGVAAVKSLEHVQNVLMTLYEQSRRGTYNE